MREASGEGIARLALRATAERVVIDDATIGFHTASAGAWVRALVLVARSVLRALRIDNAFRLAVRRGAYEGLLARAHGLVIHGTAQTVRSAECRRARVPDGRLGFCFRLEDANRERIADVAGLAGARGYVIDNRTLRTDAAHTRTRILAFVANASFVRGTVRAEDALRLAALVRISVVIVDAYARARVIPLLTNRVGTTRRRLARIYHFLCGENIQCLN